MKNEINTTNLDYFAFNNIKFLKAKPRGIVTRFKGLTMDVPLKDLLLEGRKYAKANILFLYPYTSPWAWMNDEAIFFIDSVLDAAREAADVENAPLVLFGESMGGHGVFLYSIFGRHKPNACAAVCPVCDLVFHVNEQKSILTSLYSAFSHYSGTLEENLREYSPLNLVDRMPEVPYLIIHCRADKLVNVDNHSEKLRLAMLRHGMNIEYFVEEDSGHCELKAGTVNLLDKFIISNISNNIN